MRVWILRAGPILLVLALLGPLAGCGHDPNHDINIEQARAAADRVHKRPDPHEKVRPGAGG